ncbi:glutathione S-transferase family protein [Aurantiacibacter hainanensis]|uniref:glutathione S-transferase family protein n=1 Tax=Aurantiacibacter hainanensis TaxID=3076114 RepID=UPI0030C71F26
MSAMQASPVTVSAFSWVPEFARGNVRDLPVRWALEEIGRPFETHLLDANTPRDAEYLAWQPFGQVPAMRNGGVSVFEAAAILLYLGEQEERLLPRDPAPRWRAISWLFASVNSLEPPVRQVALLPLFHGDQPWCEGAVKGLTPLAEQRLQRLSDALDDNDWIAGEFSIADIMLVFLLRTVGGEAVTKFANLVAYVERGKARPAHARALQSQLDDFEVEAEA